MATGVWIDHEGNQITIQGGSRKIIEAVVPHNCILHKTDEEVVLLEFGADTALDEVVRVKDALIRMFDSIGQSVNWTLPCSFIFDPETQYLM